MEIADECKPKIIVYPRQQKQDWIFGTMVTLTGNAMGLQITPTYSPLFRFRRR